MCILKAGWFDWVGKTDPRNQYFAKWKNDEMKMEDWFPPVFIVVVVIGVYRLANLLNMNKEQSKFNPPRKSNGEQRATNGKKSHPANGVSQNGEKRMKPNPNLMNGNEATVARGASVTNWEKFKDLVKEEKSDEKKNKGGNLPAYSKPFSRQRKTANNGESVTQSVTELSSIQQILQKKKINK